MLSDYIGWQTTTSLSFPSAVGRVDENDGSWSFPVKALFMMSKVALRLSSVPLGPCCNQKVSILTNSVQVSFAFKLVCATKRWRLKSTW